MKRWSKYILTDTALVAGGLLIAFLGWYHATQTLELELAQPFWLFGGILLAIISILHLFFHRSSTAAAKISSLTFFDGIGTNWRGLLKSLPFALAMAGLGLLILAMARPQEVDQYKNRTTEGIDIVVSMDVSTSMLAKDFRPNRLEAAKEVAIQFVKDRPNDKIGIVIYAGESLTQSPLTTDHGLLQRIFSEIETGLLEDGTAIGFGLATAVNRLKDSEAKSKVIILLTDGVNNSGQVKPLDAAQIAKTFGIRVYTIGVGTNGRALMPGYDMFGAIHYQQAEVKIDEQTLKDIAQTTDGQYFRATNKAELRNIYKEIDKLEKTKFEVEEFSTRSEGFLPYGLFGGVLLLLSFVSRRTLFGTTP